MGFCQIVIAVLLAVFGLKVLSSTAFNSLLSSRFDLSDYHTWPSVAAFLFCTVVCVAKIVATSRPRDPDPPQERERTGEEERIIRQPRPYEGGYRRPQ